MGFTQVFWDLDDDPRGNVHHIAEHDVSKEEVEEVLAHPDGIEQSRSSGLLIAFGETSTGRLIAVFLKKSAITRRTRLRRMNSIDEVGGEARASFHAICRDFTKGCQPWRNASHVNGD